MERDERNTHCRLIYEPHLNARLRPDYSDYEEVGGQYYTKRGERISAYHQNTNLK